MIIQRHGSFTVLKLDAGEMAKLTKILRPGGRRRCPWCSAWQHVGCDDTCARSWLELFAARANRAVGRETE